MLGGAALGAGVGAAIAAVPGGSALMNLPGFRLHPLKWDLVGFWSVTVKANWRVVFRPGWQKTAAVQRFRILSPTLCLFARAPA